MLIATLLLTAALGTTPAQPASEAYTSTQPIQVASCSLSPQTAQTTFGGLAIPQAASVDLSFVNRSQKTVESVAFAVGNGRTDTQIVTSGTFSSGVAINQEFSAPALSAQSDVRCVVRSVAFTDGSTWQAP